MRFNVTRDVYWCVIVFYQQIENSKIANQIHGFTIDYGKFILKLNRNTVHVFYFLGIDQYFIPLIAKSVIKMPKTLMLSFVEINCGQLPLTESPGWTFDCKLMEIFTGELLKDTLVNSSLRALAVRPSLPLSIAVALLPTTDGSAGLLT